MRVITNRQLTNCAWCKGKIEIGVECIQSQANGAMKWHFSCEPFARMNRFLSNMNKPYTKEILKEENQQ